MCINTSGADRSRNRRHLKTRTAPHLAAIGKEEKANAGNHTSQSAAKSGTLTQRRLFLNKSITLIQSNRPLRYVNTASQSNEKEGRYLTG